LTLEFDEPLSTFAFKCDLRHYIQVEYEKDDFVFTIEGLLQYDKFNSLSPPHDSPHRLMVGRCRLTPV